MKWYKPLAIAAKPLGMISKLLGIAAKPLGMISKLVVFKDKTLQHFNRWRVLFFLRK